MFLKIILIGFIGSAAGSLCPLVKLDQGFIHGKSLKTIDGFKSYFGFLGIPYAKPPIGRRRFMEPVPAPKWNGIFNATEETSPCPQSVNSNLTVVEGNEDCLYLNVYARRVRQDSSIPVMVWIHGGLFSQGSSNSETYGPDFLLEKDVVLVTLNYRLGALGFLNLQDPKISGNMGMKDQVEALKWVQRNIGAFGGDPKQVTIFGHGSGAASVHLHMLSLQTKGLFHRAIAQSGSALSREAFQENPTESAHRFIELLGCILPKYIDVIDCLQEAALNDIIRHQNTMMAEHIQLFGDVPFRPSLEKQQAEITGNRPYMTATPNDIITSGLSHPVPLIMGVTSAEGSVAIPESYKSSSLVRNLDFQSLVPLDLQLEHNSPESRIAGNIICSFYFGQPPEAQFSMESFVALMGDVMTNCPVINAARKHLIYATGPLYMYHFSQDGSSTPPKASKTLQEVAGIYHASELSYLFNIVDDNGTVTDGPPEESIIRDRVVALWTNFAKSGNPTAILDDLLDVKWEPYTLDKKNYLDIGLDLSLKDNLYGERMAFWDSLYSMLHNSC